MSLSLISQVAKEARVLVFVTTTITPAQCIRRPGKHVTPNTVLNNTYLYRPQGVISDQLELEVARIFIFSFVYFFVPPSDRTGMAEALCSQAVRPSVRLLPKL